MALEPKTFEVGGYRYSCIPHSGRKSLELNRIVTGLWVKLMGNVRARSGEDDEQIERLGKFVDALAITFLEMPTDEYENLLGMTFANTVAIGGDKEPDVKLSSVDIVGDHFAEHKTDTHLVMLQIWEANKLSPFE